MNKQSLENAANCPECMNRIRFKQMPELGELVHCPKCSTLLEVVDDEPILLDWAEGFDDDVDYDDDDAQAGEDEEGFDYDPRTRRST